MTTYQRQQGAGKHKVPPSLSTDLFRQSPLRNGFCYLIFIAGWSMIATRMWHDFFSLRSLNLKRPDLTKIAMTDMLLTELQDRLPSTFSSNSKTLPNMMQLGDMDRAFRLQLIIFQVGVISYLIISRANSRPRQQTCSVSPFDPSPPNASSSPPTRQSILPWLR